LKAKVVWDGLCCPPAPGKPPSRNLRLTRFEPFRYAVVLDRHDVDDTPLNSKLWTDEDFEEIDEEIDEEEQVLAES
jgi:hypothetical protein